MSIISLSIKVAKIISTNYHTPLADFTLSSWQQAVSSNTANNVWINAATDVKHLYRSRKKNNKSTTDYMWHATEDSNTYALQLQHHNKCGKI